MIQATELRIGNLINIPESGVIATISAIGRRAFNIDVSKVDLDEADNYFDYESAHPIPLTSSILEKSGFYYNDINGDSGHWQIKHPTAAGLFEILEGEDGFFYNYQAELKYVHQLQNLFFAIAQTELNLNL